MAKSTTKNAIAAAADTGATGPHRTAKAMDGEIARLAYDLYLARGCEDGHDVEDWLQAERELNRVGVAK